MKKLSYFILALILLLGLVMAYTIPVLGNNGSIDTTTSDGTVVNGNTQQYNTRQDVYIKGKDFDPGNYYVRVTEPNGTVLGSSNGAVLIVGSDGLISNVQLWSLVFKQSNGSSQGYDLTTNSGNEYSVDVSLNSNFSNKKSDNFKVAGAVPPVPELPAGLLFGLGVTWSRGFCIDKKTSKGSGCEISSTLYHRSG